MKPKHLIIVVITFVIILAIFLACPAAANLGTEQSRQRYSLHVVQEPGTAEDIATEAGTSPEMLVELNCLEPGQILQPGDILNIPDPIGELEEPLGPSYSSQEAANRAARYFDTFLREQRQKQATRAYRGVSYKEYSMEATAYCDDPVTASGLTTDIGAVAVDPAVIPLGSAVWVEGYGYAVAVDTGGAIKGMRVDVYMDSVDEALAWGRKQVKVRVFE